MVIVVNVNSPFDIQPLNAPQQAHVNRAECIARLDPMTKKGSPQNRHGACTRLMIAPTMPVLGIVADDANKSL
jgi:hypothetical protein